ncbi:MAG: hypothetical protein AAB740_04905, partial [Patescibacteria group bacterium]
MHFYTYDFAGLKTHAREAGLRFNRPWQKELVVDEKSCPFCKPDNGHRVLLKDDEIRWYVIENKFPASPVHYMALPEKCWSSDRLRILGGVKEIENALDLL